MRTLPLLAAGSLLAACATTSIEDADEMARDELPDLPAAWAQDASSADVQFGWIDQIGDPQLSKLVRIAQQNNQDVRIALANVERSRALLVQAGADRFPEVLGTASADATGLTSDGGTLSRSSFAGFSVSWEVDVWGRIRTGRQANVASFLSAEEDLRFSRYSIAAQVAQTYFAAIEAYRQAEVTASTLAALRETDRIVRTRFEEGEATAEDTALSQTDVASTAASLAVNRASYRTAVRALEVLLNEYPASKLVVRKAFPDVPPPPAAGLPSDLLERRPDILSASRRVAVAANFVSQARAARLPSITLTGSYGGSSSVGAGGLSNSLALEEMLWSAVGELVGPIFDAGERKAQVDIERADLDAALAEYVQTALSAFEEVESSLDRNAAFAQQVASLVEAAEASEKAFSLALFRYREGETDLVDVLDIRQRVLSSESNLAAARRSRLDEWIALNLALGGAFFDPNKDKTLKNSQALKDELRP
ncbi:MAG: efflux transporter outer membrane subunit [Pseudomonadota bacterium]